MSIEQKNKFNSNTLFIFVLFFVLPVLLSSFFALRIIDSYELTKQSDCVEQLQQQSLEAHSQLTQINFHTKIFNKFASDIHHKELTNFNINGARETFTKKYGISFIPFIFNEEGKLIQLECFPKGSANVIEFYWKHLLGKTTRHESAAKKPILQQLLGPKIQLRDRNIKQNVCHKCLFFKTNAFLFRNRLNKNSNAGSILIATSKANLKQIFEFSNIFNDNDFTYIINNLNNVMSTTSPENAKKIILHANELDNIFRYNKHIWFKNQIGDIELIVGKGFNLSLYFWMRVVSLALFFTLLCTGTLIFYKSVVLGKSIWISIRYKLVAIFILSTYTPLAAIFMLGVHWLHERQLVIEEKATTSTLEILHKVDADFSRREKEILKKFQTLYRDNTWQKKLGTDWSTNFKIIKKVVRAPQELNLKYFFNWLDIRDINTNSIFSSGSGDAQQRIEYINRTMSKMCMERYMSDQLGITSSRPVNNNELFYRSFLNNPLIGFSHLFESPGRLVRMSFEGSNDYWYWNYFPNLKGDVAYMCTNSKASYNFIKYITKSLANRFSYNTTNLQVIAHIPQKKVWFPQRTAICNELEKIEASILTNSNNKATHINYKGSKYIVVSLLGIRLQDAILFCLYPYNKITEEIARLKVPLYTSIFLLLLISAFTGLILTEAFLVPISNLSDGVKALQKRDVSFRVNIPNNDELGELGITFNQMMEEAKEMVLAGAVQQCLIPTIIPKISNYELAIYNKMTTDVGGDYCDAFQLDETSYLLTLGDVTGHGVSASILTTMVKAIVHRFSKKPTTLDILLKHLSHMIFDLVKRKKLMTFCAAILDKNKHSITLSNAGHPYPFICSPSGEAQMISHSSLPLGASKKRSIYPTTTIQIQPGEVFIIYSDGFPEGENKDGIPYGFERIGQVISQNINKPASIISEKLVEDFFAHYSADELDDDLTMIILKRNLTS